MTENNFSLKFPLKKQQEDAINAILEGKDVLVALPTGYGKSLIFTMLPVVHEQVRNCQFNDIFLARKCHETFFLARKFIH